MQSTSWETLCFSSVLPMNIQGCFPLGLTGLSLCCQGWRRQWQPTPVLLPGESHGWRILVGYSPMGPKESDMTEWLHFLCFISPAVHMMYSACNLNKQGDNIQPWRTPFPIWNQSVFHVQFSLLLSDLHTDFSRGRSGGLVFPSLSEFASLLWLMN